MKLKTIDQNADDDVKEGRKEKKCEGGKRKKGEVNF